MFKFKKLTAIALVAVAAMGLLAGCGSEKSKMTQEAGVLRVGSETTFPPFEFTEGDKYVGFDVDLSEAISMGDRVIVLSHRPGTIRSIIPVSFEPGLTPLEKRNDSHFKSYFNLIWKEFNQNE